MSGVYELPYSIACIRITHALLQAAAQDGEAVVQVDDPAGVEGAAGGAQGAAEGGLLAATAG